MHFLAASATSGLQWSSNGTLQNDKVSQRFIGVKRNAERYMFCFPRPWMRSGPESGNPGSLCVRLSPSLTFWPLSRFWHFWAKKCISGPISALWDEIPDFGPKKHFWAQNRFLAQKLWFPSKTICFMSIRGQGPKKRSFCKKYHFCAKSELLGQKSVFGA